MKISQKLKGLKALLKVSKTMEDNDMKKALKQIDGVLSKLPFNGFKTDLGGVITLLSAAILIVEKLIPVAHDVIALLPPEQAASVTLLIGTLTGAVGYGHRIVKALLAFK